jgi:hypothetical protein
MVNLVAMEIIDNVRTMINAIHKFFFIKVLSWRKAPLK